MQKNKSLFKNLLFIDTLEYGLQFLTVNGSDYKSEPAGYKSELASFELTGAAAAVFLV